MTLAAVPSTTPMRIHRHNVRPAFGFVRFTFDAEEMSALPGETIAAALGANGIAACDDRTHAGRVLARLY